MTDYITDTEFMSRHGITANTNTARIGEHITAASRKVDAMTFRQYGPHSGGATARYFRPLSCGLVYIDDAYEITSVETDADDDGTFETTWTTADYETEPANGVGSDGQSGWPTYLLRAVGSSLWFPSPAWNRRRTVKVTAKWGWSAVPQPVIEATHLLTHRLYYEVSVPGGVTLPNPEFGLPGSPLMRPYTAEKLLRPFVRPDYAVGIAG